MFKTIIAALSFCLIGLFSALALAQNFDEIELKTTHVGGNVYMLEGVGGFAGGNIGVSAGSDGVLIVDDQFLQMADKIRDAIGELSDGELRFVLNTHWHGDHTGGNIHFSKDATIIAHHNVRKRLMSKQSNHFGASPPQPKKAWPVITFDHSLTIHFNDEDIQFIHFPKGHTDGDGVVYFPTSKVAHLGDHFFVGRFPFVDLNSGGNVIGYTENIAKMLELFPADVKIIPGHGPLADIEDLKRFHHMLVETTSTVKAYKDKGMSLEEAQEEGLPLDWADWGTGFIVETDWIAFVYMSL